MQCNEICTCMLHIFIFICTYINIYIYMHKYICIYIYVMEWNVCNVCFLLNSCNVSLCVCVHACIQHTSMHRCMYVQKSPSVLILSPLAKGMEFQPFGFVFFLMTWSACWLW